MYRRRNQRVQQGSPVVPPKQEHPQEKPQEQPKQKQEEPVIKAAIAAQRKGTLYEKYCPMVNVLRPINYIEDKDESHHSVPFDVMVDVLLSKGYLNGNFKTYKAKYAGNEPSADAESWSEIYTKTTNYERSILSPGDIIYSNDGIKTIAFLVNTVYKSGAEYKKLDINPPIGAGDDEPVDDGLGVVLSTLSDCNGTVYPFANGVTLRQLVEYPSEQGKICLVSKTKTDDKLRKLVPTNMSKPNGTNPDATGDTPSFTAKIGGPEDGENDQDKIYTPENYAEIDSETPQNQFNLTSGCNVDGWLIYMYSTKTEAEAGDNYIATIVGDVVRTGSIMVASLENSSISLGGVLTFPYIAAAGQQADFTYAGNCQGFASEPKNSEQYQINYGDTSATETLSAKESSIYTFTCFTKGTQPEPEPETPGSG